MRTKISRISYFSFSFKLHNKKKVSFKSMVWRDGYKKIFAGGWGVDL